MRHSLHVALLVVAMTAFAGSVVAQQAMKPVARPDTTARRDTTARKDTSWQTSDTTKHPWNLGKVNPKQKAPEKKPDEKKKPDEN